MTQHIRIHKNERHHKCTHPGCTKTFTQLIGLQRHSKIHTLKPSTTFTCPHEGCTFSSEFAGSLKSHLISHKKKTPSSDSRGQDPEPLSNALQQLTAWLAQPEQGALSATNNAISPVLKRTSADFAQEIVLEGAPNTHNYVIFK